MTDFEQARALHRDGRFADAERAYRALASIEGERASALEALAELYIQVRRPDRAVAVLAALARENPASLAHTARLASLLDGLGQREAAIDRYREWLERCPGSGAAHFNLGLLYKKDKRYPEAVAAYQAAIESGIGDPQEVWSNLGVLYAEMRDAARAAEMYERALAVDPGYLPALFNRAGLLEESGERDRALEIYRRILAAEPAHWESLARIAHATRASADDPALLQSLREAVADAPPDSPAREGLQFALGKVLDDLGRYDEAFTAFRAANAAGARLRRWSYDPAVTGKAFDRLIGLFDRDWIERVSTDVRDAPIFVCGMFRSGSTLVERILGAHPGVTPGGELYCLPWLLARRLSPWPERARRAQPAELRQVAEEYRSRVAALFPGRSAVTDKRPDNFLHLGVVKAMFPAARIVCTRRNRLDNCLSIYFTPLGGTLSYAADLENTAHYYGQHERLMAHWRQCFGESIFTVDYDELVVSPEPVLRGLLEFLGLEWSDRCLDFRNAGAPVATASLWQVREPLHARSSGRWRNYAKHLEAVPPL